MNAAVPHITTLRVSCLFIITINYYSLLLPLFKQWYRLFIFLVKPWEIGTATVERFLFANVHVPCFCFCGVGVCTFCMQEQFSLSAVSYQQCLLTHATVAVLSWPHCQLPTVPALPWESTEHFSCREAIFRTVVTAELGSPLLLGAKHGLLVAGQKVGHISIRPL